MSDKQKPKSILQEGLEAYKDLEKSLGEEKAMEIFKKQLEIISKNIDDQIIAELDKERE